MVKQVNITDFAVPKKSLPETQKRKRNAEQVSEGQPEVISPLQASPEHKAVRKTTKDDDKGPMESTPCTDTSLQEQSKEDIKRKTRIKVLTSSNLPSQAPRQGPKGFQWRPLSLQALQLQLS